MVKMDYVWDRTTEFLSNHLSALLPIALLAMFVPLSIVNGLGPLWETASQGQRAVLAACYVAAMLVIWWGYLAVTAMAVGGVDGVSHTVVATRRFGPMIGVYLLLGAVAFALLLPMGVLAGFAGLDIAAMQRGEAVAPTSPGVALASVVYLLVYLIVVLVVAARLSPLSAVIVAERRGVGAIARAFALTRGMTWRLIGVVILYVVVSQVAAMAAQTVFGSVLRIFDRGEGAITLGKVITAIVVAAVSTGFTVLGAAFTAKLYVAIQRTLEPVVTQGWPESDTARA